MQKQTWSCRALCHQKGYRERKLCLERWLNMKLLLRQRVFTESRSILWLWMQLLRTFISSFSVMTLYADLALLDPKNFDRITANTSDLLQTGLQELSKCLVKFDSTETVTNLESELSSLAEQWPRLKRSTFDKYTIRTIEDVPEGDNGVESWLSWKNCVLLLFLVNTTYTNAYPILGLSSLPFQWPR